MADIPAAQHQRLHRLAKGWEHLVRTMRARTNRFRVVFWIGVLLLPQLILVLLDRR